MAGIAQLAKAGQHQVKGCDENVYPPMSTLLEEQQIEVQPGYLPEHIDPDTDQVIIGNALSRGNPIVEHVLDEKVPYQSGPQWLHDQILRHKKVIAVAGTHGKTSTSSMIAWILHHAGKNPGFLIGGRPGNFDESAHSGAGEHFVIEADEYDTAFFDKRSKFVHYAPNIAVLNNLEFDHADIFDNLDQIKTQFHHLIRIVPQNGHIIVNGDDSNLASVLEKGSWSSIHSFSTRSPHHQWHARANQPDGASFSVFQNGEHEGDVDWDCIGQHNIQNALAAILAAKLCGVSVQTSCAALTRFIPTDRRMQSLYDDGNVVLYEDFAHHPTAISTSLEAIRARYPEHYITAIVEPRSNTMRSGHHNDTLLLAFDKADEIIVYHGESNDWDRFDNLGDERVHFLRQTSAVLEKAELSLKPNSVIICMSNGSFDGIPKKLANWLKSRGNF